MGSGLWARRRLLFSLGLCLVVVVFAVVVLRTLVPSSPAHQNTHATFLFQLDRFPHGPLHPGQHVSARWVPELLTAASTGPAAPVSCTLGLYGPYDTEEDVTAAEHNMAQISPAEWGAPAFAVAPQVISNQVPDPQPIELDLPAALQPGYFVVASRAVNSRDRASDGDFSLVRIIS